MTETNASETQHLLSRGCVSMLAFLAFAGLLVVGIPYVRERQRLTFERQKAEWRHAAFERVKNGEPSVLVMDSKLLPMLARDADCIANLKELNFSMTEITPNDARFVSQLKNVRALTFYDTHGADLVLENARDLPITSMGIEMDRLSKDSLVTLADFPDLTDVHFEHIMYPNEIAILEKLPPRITVRDPDDEKYFEATAKDCDYLLTITDTPERIRCLDPAVIDALGGIRIVRDDLFDGV